MHDGPGERKEDHALPFQIQRVVPAHRGSAGIGLKARYQKTALQVDDLVVAGVNDAEFESAKVTNPRHHRILTEENVGDRTGEARENQSGNHGQAQQTDDRLQRDQNIGGHTHGHDRSVTYRRRGVNAEEEGLEEGRSKTDVEGADQATRSASIVEQSEKAIERKVGNGNEEKEAAPGGADQVGVSQKRTQPSASSFHVEAAVPIDQAKLTL